MMAKWMSLRIVQLHDGNLPNIELVSEITVPSAETGRQIRIWLSFDVQLVVGGTFRQSTSFSSIEDPHMQEPQREERSIEKSTTSARQGVTGHNVRYVLAVSLGAAVVILACVWFAYFAR
jgi:hypothetical protein